MNSMQENVGIQSAKESAKINITVKQVLIKMNKIHLDIPCINTNSYIK